MPVEAISLHLCTKVLSTMATAFFSYSRTDSEFALRLAGDLKAAGLNVWLDQLDIVPGQQWDRAVEEQLTRSPRMLVILSPSSVESANVMDEVSFALEQRKTVIPIIHENCKIPFRLRRVQHVDFTKDYARGLNDLLKALGPEPKERQSEHVVSEVQGSIQMGIPDAVERQIEAPKESLEDERRKASEEVQLQQKRKLDAEQARREQSFKRVVPPEPGSGVLSRLPAAMKFGLPIATIVVVALILTWHSLQSPSTKQEPVVEKTNSTMADSQHGAEAPTESVAAKPTERTPGVLEEKGQTGQNERPKTSNDTDPKPAAPRPTTQSVNDSGPKPAHQTKPQRIRVGGAVQAANLLTRVQPVYPPLARQTRVSGTVRLRVTIGKDGAVQQLEVLSGHPLLVQSAMDAVKQWRYKPTLLNGAPVEVDTEIDVNFSLVQ